MGMNMDTAQQEKCVNGFYTVHRTKTGIHDGCTSLCERVICERPECSHRTMDTKTTEGEELPEEVLSRLRKNPQLMMQPGFCAEWLQKCHKLYDGDFTKIGADFAIVVRCYAQIFGKENR